MAKRISMGPSFVQAPFSIEVIQRLNEYQTGTAPGMPGQPMICENSGDGRHGDEGGIVGVLIATKEGFVCPHCKFKQSWAPISAVQLQMDLVGIFGGAGQAMVPRPRETLEARMAAYAILAGRKKRGTAVMADCLKRRKQQLDDQRAKHREPIVLWTVYERPRDFPDGFIARKWAVDGEPPQPRPTDDIVTDDTLEGLRSKLPRGLNLLPRAQQDDPNIVESWI